MTVMDDAKQRVAIAEACGYDFQWRAMNPYAYLSFDPLNDLNAMHEAEKALTTEADTNRYCYWLNKVAPRIFFWRYTARQRAEAFLRTIGKWEDDSDGE